MVCTARSKARCGEPFLRAHRGRLLRRARGSGYAITAGLQASAGARSAVFLAAGCRQAAVPLMPWHYEKRKKG
jgi:hypothetical protein